MKPGSLSNANFTAPQGSIAYHIPCHLRAQNIGQPFRAILGGVPGTTIEPIEQCSAFDGTWGMKTEFYETSRRKFGMIGRPEYSAGEVPPSLANPFPNLFIVSDTTATGFGVAAVAAAAFRLSDLLIRSS